MAVSSSLDLFTGVHKQYTYTWDLWIPMYRASTCNPLFVKLLLFILTHLSCLNDFPCLGFIFM